ncbi:hypothetical protein EAF04_009114 [Stromatinia cepivora]|nr:hypothetical protein EAF04_009114 [Stromatinia cepivora]
MAADAPNRFRPGRYGAVPAPPTADEWSKFSDFEKDQKRRQEWLKRSYGWEINARGSRNAPKWIGERLLGKGCAVLKQGFYDKGRYSYKRIVVKQASSPEAKASLENGAYIIRRLREEIPDHVAEHIVLPARDYTEDAGTGTDDTFDPVYVHEFAPDTVARTYTSYYEGGNFQQWLEENFGSDYPSENDIWSVMECLARICMNLEYGDETRSKVDGAKVFQPIVHLDIRPQSIFCARSDMCKDGQHANRTKFLLGNFEKAVNVSSDPTDKKWMFHIHGRADPNWAAPEQKYPQMEGRSISSPCNIFGIGALLYYMIKGKEIDDRAWKIGMPDSPANQEVKLYFGGDLITEPIAEQREYSKALIRVILQCLAYLPSDRITATELRNISAKATNASSRTWLRKEIQYKPGDPATIFEPQNELQPNDYTVADLSLKDKISIYSPPRDHRETLRARAEKWLSNFWIFPDSAKSQEARDKQRLIYEREVEKQRQEAAAVEAKKQAQAQAVADLNAEIRREEEQEEAERIAREERIAQRKAETARKIAAIRGEGEEQILLPQPNNKRDRSPEPPQQTVRKKIRSAPPPEISSPKAPVAQGSGSRAMDVDVGQDRTILPPRDKGKGKEIVAVLPEIPPVSGIAAPTASGVSAQAGPAPPPEPPTTSGKTAQAGPAPSGPVTSGPVTSRPVTSGPVTSGPVTSRPVTSGPVTSGSVTSRPVTSGPVTSGPVTSGPVTSGPVPLSKPSYGIVAQLQTGSDWWYEYKGEARERAAAFDKAEEEKVKKRKESWARQISEDKRRREEREEKERKVREDIDRELEEGKQRAAAEYERTVARENAWDKSMAEGRKEPSKLIAPPLGGASRPLSSYVDTPSMRRSRKSPPRVSPFIFGAIQHDDDDDVVIDDDYDVEEVAFIGSRARSPPRPISPIKSTRYRRASPKGVPIGMQAPKPKLYCSICGKEYQVKGFCESHIKKYHKGRKGKVVEQRPENLQDPVGKTVRKRKAPAKSAKEPTLAETQKFFDDVA